MAAYEIIIRRTVNDYRPSDSRYERDYKLREPLETCEWCPYRHYDRTEQKTYCTTTMFDFGVERRLIEDKAIPSWCPMGLTGELHDSDL